MSDRADLVALVKTSLEHATVLGPVSNRHVIVMSGFYDLHETSEITAAFRHYFKADCPFLIFHDPAYQTGLLDEDAMRAHGWVRA